MFQGRSSLPGGEWGYARGGSDYQAAGSGSGMGNTAQGTAGLGQGIGAIGSFAGAWEPGPVFLIGLIIAEMVAFHILSRVLK